MAKRSSDREGSQLARKLIMWLVIVLVTIWAARNPHQAAAAVHAIAIAMANLTSQASKHGH